jgi:hypothetical protein
MGSGGMSTARFIRSVRTIALVGAVLVVVAACQPIVIDTQAGTLVSDASFRAVPTTLTVDGTDQPAVELRMRDCSNVLRKPEADQTPLRPVARVTVADGTSRPMVIFDNEASPPTIGSAQVVAGDPVNQIIVPLGSASGSAALRIEPGCATAGVHDGGRYAVWRFTACHTDVTARTCPATSAGQWDNRDWRVGGFTKAAPGAFTLATSDDGHHAVIESQPTDALGNQPMALLDADTGAQTPIGEGMDVGVAMSADGSVVAFTVLTSDPSDFRNPTSRIDVWNAASGTTQTIPTPAGYWAVTGITDDGDEIIYSVFPRGDIPDRSPTYAYRISNGKTQTITTTPNYQVADVSGDGRFVLFTVLDDQFKPQPINRAVLLDRKTHTETVIGNDPDTVWHTALAVSDDGRYVLYSEGDPRFVNGTIPAEKRLLLDRTTGTTKTLATDVAQEPNGAMSGDGRFVAFNDWGVNIYDQVTGRTDRIDGVFGATVSTVSDDGRFAWIGPLRWDRTRNPSG